MYGVGKKPTLLFDKTCNLKKRGVCLIKVKDVENIAGKLIAPILEENDFEFVDLEFVKEGPNWYLRVYIDKPDGVTIDDCEMISKAFDKKLDEIDPVEQPYILEVSSPGLDRPLKKDEDFVKFKGKMVEIKLFKPINGKKVHIGELIGIIDNQIAIFDNGEELKFDRKDVASCRLAVIF